MPYDLNGRRFSNNKPRSHLLPKNHNHAPGLLNNTIISRERLFKVPKIFRKAVQQISIAPQKEEGLKNFSKLKLIGIGSYGKVYKATRIRDGIIYAIKELDISHMTPQERTDSLNEVRILASITHNNIIRFCDAFLQNNNLYLVTEFAMNGDLFQLLEKRSKTKSLLHENTIWTYFIQICLAVKELHSRNILHRDIKPQNVFLSKTSCIKLGDLGSSRLLKTPVSGLDSIMTRTQCGTPYYMSPEIWKNQAYGNKTDIWALGTILYNMATLSPPFNASNIKDLANKVCYHNPPFIRHYSNDLNKIVTWLMEKNPYVRPTINELLNSPAIQQRMHLIDNINIEDDSKFKLINTIIPSNNLHVLQKRLPQSSYKKDTEQDNQPPGSIEQHIIQQPIRPNIFPMEKKCIPTEYDHIISIGDTYNNSLQLEEANLNSNRNYVFDMISDLTLMKATSIVHPNLNAYALFRDYNIETQITRLHNLHIPHMASENNKKDVIFKMKQYYDMKLKELNNIMTSRKKILFVHRCTKPEFKHKHYVHDFINKIGIRYPSADFYLLTCNYTNTTNIKHTNITMETTNDYIKYLKNLVF